ncbi:MAG: response regulator [Opitutales bacterium]
MSDPIKVMIVEDNQAFEKSMRQMLKLNAAMEWVGSFASAEECQSRFRENTYEVDVVLLDLRLPRDHGLTLIPFFLRQKPSPKILVVTQDSDYHTTLEAIQIGANGYVLKSMTLEAIERAIQEVHEGGCVLDPQLSRFVLDAIGKESRSEGSPLSEREREILELLSLGFVKKEVAEQLNISYRTVAEHTENIYKKLQVRNVAAAVASAVRRRLI